jgi:hypothetical protein
MRNSSKWQIASIIVLTMAFFSVLFLHPNVAYASSSNQNVNANVVVPSTCYLTATPNTITFGSVPPGSNYNDNVLVTGADVNGNVNSYLFVSGGNWIATSHFGVSNTTWNQTTQTKYTLATALSTTPANTAILLPFGIGTSNSIYFGMEVPGGTPSGTYTQTITLYASC